MPNHLPAEIILANSVATVKRKLKENRDTMFPQLLEPPPRFNPPFICQLTHRLTQVQLCALLAIWSYVILVAS